MNGQSAQRVPWVTLVLIVANLAMAFGVFLRPELLDRLAFAPQTPSPIAALTCLFVHVNVVHLLGNLVFLAAVGPILEFSKGPMRYSAVYVIGGLGGVLAYWLIAGRSVAPLPLVGASGAIAACVAFCAVRFIRTKVPVFVGFALPVGVLAALWIVLQAGGALVRLGDIGAADSGFWPHLGGILVGLLLAAVMGAGTDAKRAFGHHVLDKMNERGAGASLAAAKQHLAQHPGDLKALWQKAGAEIDLGDTKEAGATLMFLLARETREGQARALTQLIEIHQVGQMLGAERLKWADEFRGTNPSLSESLYRSIVSEPFEVRKPDALLALAELMFESRPEEARDFAEVLVRDYELHPATDSARAKGLLN